MYGGKEYGDFMEVNETLIFKTCDLSWDMNDIYSNGDITNQLCFWVAYCMNGVLMDYFYLIPVGETWGRFLAGNISEL